MVTLPGHKNRAMAPFVLVFILLAGYTSGESDFHRGLSSQDLNKYFGVPTPEDVPSYEIVHPVHTAGSPQRSSSWDSKGPLAYDLTAFGEDYRLRLQHNDRLIAPGCLVYHLQANGSREVRPCPSREEDCYYHGASLAHNGSQALLSTCGGLHGVVRLPEKDHDLVIEPLQPPHADRVRRAASGQPHLVFRRSVTERHCAYKDLAEDASQLARAALRSGSRSGSRPGRGRGRRGALEKQAEMLLVGDKTMHQHHGQDLRQYLLTAANVAARILLDSSIGTPLHFTVVKIVILEEDQPGLEIEEDAETLLDNFCTWQEVNNPRDDTNPQHHDGAALFTRTDIVHNGVRATVGYGTVAGMCGVKTRCSINEDDGMGVGVTLAHETGHTLGMRHDGDGNNCENGKNVMSSQGGGGTTATMWSSCSRQAYATFLRTTRAECLDDKPQSSVALPKDLPGVIYSGDDQCALYIGEGATICEGTDMVHGDECSHLVCFDPEETGVCRGDSVPRLDGTMCGDRKYCMRGQCVDIGPNGPAPRNGGWSAWEDEWSACSRTCGGGVRTRNRKCDTPKPALGGADCLGTNVMAEMCNMQDCRSSEEAFREAQCAMTDSVPMNGQSQHWVPVNMMGEQQCELHCRIDGQRTVLLRNYHGQTFYQDGTVCNSASSAFARCVDGKCRDFGCDGKTGSRWHLDRCGVCGGGGDTCSKQSGDYDKGRKDEYVTFLTMPKGSTAVKITNTNRFTQMSVKVGGKRLFSEDGGESDESGTYTADEVVVLYTSPSAGHETIDIPGPTPEAVEAQVWRKFNDNEFQGVAPQINYEYFVPSSASNPADNYQWTATNAACTKTCGGGMYHRVIACTSRGSGAEVDLHFCDLRHKPSITGSPCNNQACPPSWTSSGWGQCSQTCGGGQQTRSADCVQSRGGREEGVAQDQCPSASRPLTSRACNTNVVCPAVWLTGAWSACSLTCGKGVHTRTASCVSDETSKTPVDASQCPASTKPLTSEACVTAVCEPTITGSACKDTDSTCAGYGLTMCEDFESFAKQSCMKHCSFCTEDGTTGGACADTNADCAGYGSSVCTGDYAEWAKTNCAKLCGYCSGAVSGGGGGGGGQTSGTTSCVDKSGDCQGYGQTICTGDYATWAVDNCASYCGHCTAAVGTGTGGGATAVNNNSGGSGGAVGGATAAVNDGACKDENADCASYGQSVCTGAYADWAKDNCAKFCAHCSTAAVTSNNGGDGGGGGGGGGGGASASSGSCSDKADNCAAYGEDVCTGSYAAWAGDNCQKFCGHCSSSAASSADSSCVDASTDCLGYGDDVCTTYAEWAATMCQKFCNKCGSRRRRSVAAPPPPRPLCNNVLTDPEGSVSLIGQPLESTCTQVIAAPPGSRVQLSFTALRISCQDGDWLEVEEEGGKKGKAGRTSRRDLCAPPRGVPVQWTATGHVVTVRLSVAVPGHGYNLTYRVEPPSNSLSQGCHRVLTDPTGRVSSPGFPAPYGADQLCLTTIVAPPGFSVLLHFDLFHLQDDSDACHADSLTIYDEELGHKDVLCGALSDLDWQSRGSRVKVVFASDQQTSGPGFLASYKFIAP